ncbi:MAG: Haloacid dehalogenase domain protein hydrolase, partial [Rhodocyclales bacterium]|nr:Haloacid dehalogenase domain protein hydrolase [Rhodocyclales bacterium]
MSAAHGTVFLIDVDNTLLDNDCVVGDLRKHLLQEFGSLSAERYWTIFEELRSELGYADYLGALQRYRVRELVDPMNDARLLQMSTFLIDYPFADRLYAKSLSALKHLQR